MRHSTGLATERCTAAQPLPSALHSILRATIIEYSPDPATDDGSANGWCQLLQCPFQCLMYLQRRLFRIQPFEFLDQKREIPFPLPLMRRLAWKEAKIVRGLVHGRNESVDRIMPPWEHRGCDAVQQVARCYYEDTGPPAFSTPLRSQIPEKRPRSATFPKTHIDKIQHPTGTVSDMPWRPCRIAFMPGPSAARRKSPSPAILHGSPLS